MPDSEVGRFYVYKRDEHRCFDIDPDAPNGADNNVVSLSALADKVVGNPVCFRQLMGSPEVWYFFAVPEELDSCTGAKLERLALMRHIRLLERVKARLARHIAGRHGARFIETPHHCANSNEKNGVRPSVEHGSQLSGRASDPHIDR